MKKLLFYIFIVITCVSLTCCDDNQSLAQNMQNIGEKLDQTKDNAFYPLDEDKDDEQLVAEAKAAVEQLFTKDVRETIVAAAKTINTPDYPKEDISKILNQLAQLAQKYGSDAKAWSAIRTYMKYKTVEDFTSASDMQDLYDNTLNSLVNNFGVPLIDEIMYSYLPPISKLSDFRTLMKKLDYNTVPCIPVPTGGSLSIKASESTKDFTIEPFAGDVVSEYGEYIEPVSYSNTITKINDFKFSAKGKNGDSFEIEYKIKDSFLDKFSWTDGSQGNKTVKFTVKIAKANLKFITQGGFETLMELPYKGKGASGYDGYTEDDLINVVKQYELTQKDGKKKGFLAEPVTEVDDPLPIKYSYSVSPNPKDGKNIRTNEEGKYICGNFVVRITATVEGSENYNSQIKDINVNIQDPLDNSINKVAEDAANGLLGLLGSVIDSSGSSNSTDEEFNKLLVELYGEKCSTCLYPDLLNVLFIREILDDVETAIGLLSLGDSIQSVGQLFADCYPTPVTKDTMLTWESFNSGVGKYDSLNKALKFSTDFDFSKNSELCNDATILGIRNFCHYVDNPAEIAERSDIFEVVNKMLLMLRTAALFEEEVTELTNDGILYHIVNEGKIEVLGIIKVLEDPLGIPLKFTKDSRDWNKVMNIEDLITTVIDIVKPALTDMQDLKLM